MIKAVFNKIPNKIIIGFALFGLVLLMPLFFYTGLLFVYRNKVIPRVMMGGYEISGFKKYQIEELFSNDVKVPEKIELLSGGEKFEIPLKEIGFSYDPASTFVNAYKIFRSENYYPEAYKIIASLNKPSIIYPVYNYKSELLEEYISVISSQLSIGAIQPSLELADGSVKVIRGAAGREVNVSNLKTRIEKAFKSFNFQAIEISIEKVDPTLNSQEEEQYLKRAQSFVNKTLTIKSDNYTENLETKTLFSFILPSRGFSDEQINLYIDGLKKKVEIEPQNSVFTFKDGRVQEFVPSKEGVVIKEDQLALEIKKALNSIEYQREALIIDVPVIKTSPEITNAQVNDMGINEMIGKGESFFKGSIPGRVHNVGLAASRINGVLIKPGETFSFNTSVGDVSVLTGYKQAYIIQDGKTILGDGGGVCQVSTTLFRAVLASGLPIVERAPHSYRVGYYEQNSGPGLDATVFSPTTDFKFKNDTPANLLIQTTFEPKFQKLVVEIYGTSDGRVSDVTKPVVTSSTPPPEDLYMDDPTLPVGTIKQIDYKAWGAKVIFDYTVTRNGETLQQKKFISNYKPWQAKFLRGTAPR